MVGWKREFISLMVEQGVLRFGDFTLKSGRRSPYFFNLGAVSTGSALARMGDGYAQAFRDQAVRCDGLFGPAYKGIPIATAMAIALARGTPAIDLPVAFNRKEKKAHGEGGQLIGAPLRGRVLIVDDVVTDGAAKLESKAMIEGAGAEPCGVLIALDRQEYLDGRRITAAQALEADHGLPVISLVNLQDVISYLDAPECPVEDRLALCETIRRYQRLYCVT
ncbi:MAG: orotate phosphoribosyltransferase [Pseudomonadales bacterium]|nr:orotate phosphoribosyltransferase [Pseudomonadales bacterium]MCP5183446.1 orotate phosphoribosyltransferase [Pseudomonadales bacterium]